MKVTRGHVASGTEIKLASFSSIKWVCEGLFIWEINCPITMSQLPLTNYPIHWVHSHDDKLDYCCTQLPSKRINGLLPHVATFSCFRALIVTTSSFLLGLRSAFVTTSAWDFISLQNIAHLDCSSVQPLPRRRQSPRPCESYTEPST
jgi:hypothetical protein